MKKLATAIAAIALIGTPVFAADIGVPPSPPPAPVYNWTGFYVGGNLGVSLGTFKTDFNAAPVTVTTTFSAPFNIPGFAGRDEVYPAGFIGGGQIGYNYQLSPIWVVGFEADFQGADEKEHSTLTQAFTDLRPTPPSGPTGATGSTVLDYATKIEWFGTARLRAGYLFGDGAVLTYVTGGLAYGKVDVGGTSTVSGSISGCSTCPVGFSTTRAVGHSNINTGWVVGTGTEGKLFNFPGWTYKIEGLYMDLGHLHDTDPPPVDCEEIDTGCHVTRITGGQTITNTHFTDTIIRLGVNYQFH